MKKYWDSVGNTSLVYIQSLSERTGCHIWGKAEFENPGGSIKDRAAKQIILEAENSGQLKPGDTIVEGTAGNTGIGLALLGKERGYQVVITMPNNQAQEKVDELKKRGAEVLLFPPCPFSDPGHFYHQAQRYAEKNKGVYWANQFENLANFRSHYQYTGPEIWQQTKGKIDYFLASVGTGGTIGGVSNYLKEKSTLSAGLTKKQLDNNNNPTNEIEKDHRDEKPGVSVLVADPFGSGIFEYLNSGQFKSEGGSVTEGIGIMRLTANFKQATVDRCFRVNDQEMINMLYHLKDKDQLFVGLSAALNLAGVYRVALENKNSGKTFVTVLGDRGDRYSSKILSEKWLNEKNLIPKPIIVNS